MCLLPRLAAAVLAALMAAVPAFAQPAPVVILIPPSGGPYTLEPAHLPQPPRTIRTTALHGDLRLAGDRLEYTPAPSFWALGSDTFVYDGARGRVTVLLLRSTWPMAASSDFERLVLPDAWSAVGDRLEIGLDGAVSGRGGASIDAGRSDAYLAIDTPPGPSSPHDGGAGGDAGHGVVTGGTIRVETMLPRAGSKVMVLYEAAPNSSSSASLRLYLRQQGTRYELVAGTLVDGVLQQETRPVPLPLGPHRWSLEWWRPLAAGVPAGLRLSVDDGLPEILRTMTFEDDDLAAHRFGSMAVETTPPDLRLDNLWIRRGDLYGEELRAAVGGAVVADVTSASAWHWDRGAEYGPGEWQPVEPATPTGAAWQPPVEWPSATYNARLVVNLAAPVAADTVLLTGTSAGMPPRLGPRDLWGVRLRPDARVGGSFLEAVVAGPGESAPRLATVPLTAGRHVIEVQWRAATSSTSRDGWLRLWLDGAPVGLVDGIENVARVDSMRMATGRPEAGWSVETLHTWY